MLFLKQHNFSIHEQFFFHSSNNHDFMKQYQHLQVGVPNGSVTDLSIHHPLGFKDGTPLKVLVVTPIKTQLVKLMS